MPEYQHIKKRPKPQPPPEPEPKPEPIPEPKPQPVPEPPKPVPTGLVLPTGTVTTFRPGSHNPYGVNWDRARAVAPLYEKWGKKTGVDPMLGIAVGLIETGWKQFNDDGSVVRAAPDGWGGGVATGMNQIKDGLWANYVPGQSIETTEGNVAVAMSLLRDWTKETGSWQGAIRKYHPGTDPRSGVTPQTYVDTVDAIFREIKKTQPPIPVPVKPADPYLIITGGVPYTVDYGFLDDAGLPYYEYVVGHGGTRITQHSGDDIKVPLGTKLYTPLSGVVICVGENGTGAWGQVCGSFVDEMTHGAGNISVITDAGIKLTFGHSGKPFVKTGDRVAAGQLMCLSGGAGDVGHCHFDVAENRNGSYWLLDPKPALRKALGQVIVPKPLITGIHWEGTSNKQNRSGVVPVALVYHVTDDMSYTNVRDWFKNPASKASSHWVIDRDGTKYQFVGSNEAAWTNGPMAATRTDIKWLADVAERHHAGRADLNNFCITIEHVGKPNVPFESVQIASSIEISQYYLSILPSIIANRGHMLRHSDIDGVDRPYCPGELFPLRDIILACGGDPVALNP